MKREVRSQNEVRSVSLDKEELGRKSNAVNDGLFYK